MSLSDLVDGALDKLMAELASVLDHNFAFPRGAFGLNDIPAFPVNFGELMRTLKSLDGRNDIITRLNHLYDVEYTIGGVTAPARDFLFPIDAGPTRSERFAHLGARLSAAFRKVGAEGLSETLREIFAEGLPDVPRSVPDGEIAPRPLESAEQFSIGWTSNQDIRGQSLPMLAGYAEALTSADSASGQFWPMLAKHGLAYNLLFLKSFAKVDAADVMGVFGDVWRSQIAGRDPDLLYVIDLRVIAGSRGTPDGGTLFTPATVTLLQRDPDAGTLSPIAVSVTDGETGRGFVFTRANSTDAAWIFALEAVRAAIGAWGISLGHLYHWHFASAALFMTWQDTVPPGHPLHRLVAPHAKHTIGFNNVLLFLWAVMVPPLTIDSGVDFLRVCNAYAKGRTFFDDGPQETIANHGLRQADFTKDEAWDLYPVARYELRVHAATKRYVQAFVDSFYPDDGDVAGDEILQKWVAASGDPQIGNLIGLGAVETREQLSRFLTSMLFRILMHGISSLNASAYPAMAFIANYPTCLNGRTIPAPTAEAKEIDLLSRLPNTTQLGQILTFFNIFVFTPPSESLIPADTDAEGPFADESNHPCRLALGDLRRTISDLIADYEGLRIEQPSQEQQWPCCIEL